MRAYQYALKIVKKEQQKHGQVFWRKKKSGESNCIECEQDIRMAKIETKLGQSFV